ncbi:MAG: transglutaminase domain-containing protein [Candidatus Promineofilum sp.]|nr:transglutaminase domain-containing protein [Promineifilum sp.]
MTAHWLVRLLDRLRPLYGWLPFTLLLGALGCVAFSVLDVGWVSDDGFIGPIMALGFVAATAAAHRVRRPAIAWSLLIAAGALLALVLVADLWPSWRVVQGGATAVVEFWRIRLAFFADRAAGWLATVRSGGRSTETAVFALGLALAGWFVGALLAWSAYRARRPFLGLTLAGFALAANTFYGQAPLYWAVFFFGLAITGGVYLSHLYHELEWQRRGIDYPAEVRTDLLIYTAGISLGLMSLAMGLPAINFRALAEAFQRQGPVVAAEQTLARAFAGVAQPRVDEGAAGGGGLPRSFLLGAGPELAETVVMTATLRPEAPVDLSSFHWRSVSFDIYTGRGWARSPEREENVDRGDIIPPETATAGQTVRVAQEIDWHADRRATRYTLGRPAVFSHDVVVMWRGRDDLVGVRGRNNAPTRYAAETLVTLATAEQLRAASPADIPPEILARYTTLSDSVPARVIDLAFEITAPADAGSLSAYDRARAIERFLHQYPYSLDLPAPPPDVDIVDHFLFDQQTGFCDYYASAMVILARAVGMPARLGVGFLQQPADSSGVQTVRQIDAHSWAEVYFAGYGWVEFEPTAPFAVDAPAVPPPASATSAPATYTPGGLPLAMPDRAPLRRDPPWALLFGLAAGLLVAGRLWGGRLAARLRPAYSGLDEVQVAFARLQEEATALGHPPRAGQTPAEFAADLLAAPLLASSNDAPLRAAVARLTGRFAARQYGPDKESTSEAAVEWQAIRTPLRRLARRRRWGRLD